MAELSTDETLEPDSVEARTVAASEQAREDSVRLTEILNANNRMILRHIENMNAPFEDVTNVAKEFTIPKGVLDKDLEDLFTEQGLGPEYANTVLNIQIIRLIRLQPIPSIQPQPVVVVDGVTGANNSS